MFAYFLPASARVFRGQVVGHDGLCGRCLHDVLKDLVEPLTLDLVEWNVRWYMVLIDEVMEIMSVERGRDAFLGS